MYSEIKRVKKRYDTNVEESSNVGVKNSFKVNENQKAEFDSWGFIYTEISNTRNEISKLGLLVRVNNSDSPNYLTPYHSHIYTFLQQLSTMVNDDIWTKIDTYWLEVKSQIDYYFKLRIVLPNKRIPFALIRNLDSLFRIGLLMQQKAGMGIRLQRGDEDMDAVIESVITGNPITKK